MTSPGSIAPATSSISDHLGDLSLQDPTHDVEGTVRSEHYISRLPNEILSMIFEIISFKDDSGFGGCDCMRTSTEPLKAVMLVCRQFYHVAIPILYRTIEFKQCFGLQPYKSLRRYVKKRPEYFEDYCRHFTLTVEPPVRPIPDARLVRELFQALPNVQCLRLNDRWKFRLPPVCESLVMLPKLRHLHVGRRMFERDVLPALQRITLPSLVHLSILSYFTGLYEGGDGLAPPESQLRIAKFTRLSYLANVGTDTNWALGQLIKWPETLHHFDINGHYFRLGRDSGYEQMPPPETNRLTMSSLHSMLLVHKNTLRTLRVGHIFGDTVWYLRGDRGGFNTHDFPNLEELALSRWDKPKDWKYPAKDTEFWLSSSIKTFRWSFGLCYFCGFTTGLSGEFGRKEEDWVRDFAIAAKNQGKPLERIVIEHEFDPNARFQGKTREDHPVWPWDRLKRLRESLESIGIALEYSPPPVSRAEWVQWVHSDWENVNPHWEVDRRLGMARLVDIHSLPLGNNVPRGSVVGLNRLPHGLIPQDLAHRYMSLQHRQ